MASAVIHICVAKKINEKLKMNPKFLYLGTIAPDLSKLIGETKAKSHFLTTGKANVPNVEAFINKYHNYLDMPFELGYLIHLYTDKLWFDGFIDNLVCANSVKLLDGTKITISSEFINKLVYEDYTNVNIDLLDSYNLDLALFYNYVEYPTPVIDEIPVNKLDILVDKMGVIIKNSANNPTYLFDIETIEKFIDESATKIYNELLTNEII